jgi:methionyl-tRNA formyltransferase
VNNASLRLAFAGTPLLAARILEHLIKHSCHRIMMVFTRPDKPSGRGKKLTTSPVKQLAHEHKLQILQPVTPADIDPDDKLSAVDVFVVVAYGLILPDEILKRPTYGCINVHTSLLPRWRGAAPIQRAIQAGDRETGVSIMQIDGGLDTGPVLARMKCPITADETAGTLQDKLAILGSECLLNTLGLLATGALVATPQEENRATYARKVTKDEAQIDWSKPAVELERLIRAFNPAPVAHTVLNGIQLRVWQATVIESASTKAPGTVIECSKNGIDVGTGKGVLRLLRVQLQGKRVMDSGEFLNGHPAFAQKTAGTVQSL